MWKEMEEEESPGWEDVDDMPPEVRERAERELELAELRRRRLEEQKLMGDDDDEPDPSMLSPCAGNRVHVDRCCSTSPRAGSPRRGSAFAGGVVASNVRRSCSSPRYSHVVTRGASPGGGASNTFQLAACPLSLPSQMTGQSASQRPPAPQRPSATSAPRLSELARNDIQDVLSRGSESSRPGRPSVRSDPKRASGNTNPQQNGSSSNNEQGDQNADASKKKVKVAADPDSGLSKWAGLLRMMTVRKGDSAQLRLPTDEPSALPTCWMSSDIEVVTVNQVEQTYTIKGFIRFAFQAGKVPSVKPLINELGLIRGWNYGVELPETGGFNRPVNTEYMFFGSRSEEQPMSPQIYYGEGEDAEGCHDVLVMNYAFVAVMAHALELRDFPFDSQFFGIKINVRRPYWDFLAVAPDWIPKKTPFIRPPLAVRLSPGLTAWSLERAFVDCMNPKPVFYLDMRRRVRYWIANFMVPIMLMTLASTFSFAVNAELLSDRLDINMALWVGGIGLRYVMAIYMPPTDTLTILDKCSLVMFCMQFLVMASNVLALVTDEATATMMDSLISTIIASTCLTFYCIILPAYVIRSHRTRARLLPWESQKTRKVFEGFESTKLLLNHDDPRVRKPDAWNFQHKRGAATNVATRAAGDLRQLAS